MQQTVREHQETERRLHRSIAETDTLLREVHHRVRNNLQVVDTLLALQIRQTPTLAENLGDLRYRVYCLGMVHQKLMQSADLETIKLGEFLRDLGLSLATSNTDRQGKVILDVTVELQDVAIKIDIAIPLGVLVTELVANARKHALPSNRHGTIGVSLSIVDDGRVRLVVSDDDIGMPAFPPPVTVGQQIIAELVDQLNGEITVDQNQGTHITVTFSDLPKLPCGPATLLS